MKMKKSQKNVWLFSMSLMLILVSCGKYEEGPMISFRSAEKRIYGNHLLKSYTVDGIDSLEQYYDTLGLQFTFIYDDISHVNTCIMNGRRKDGGGTDLYWWWELNSDESEILIRQSSGQNGVGPFGANKTFVWEVVKLKYRNIKLRTLFNDKEYEIELERD